MGEMVANGVSAGDARKMLEHAAGSGRFCVRRSRTRTSTIPSFGMAIILAAGGERLQRWASSPSPVERPQSIAVFGEPRLRGFFVSSGNMDSMVNHYTATVAKKRRRSVRRTLRAAGGRSARTTRPWCAATDQAHARTAKAPLILGGIEASLRQLAHYDATGRTSSKRSILLDSSRPRVVRHGRALVIGSPTLERGIAIGASRSSTARCSAPLARACGRAAETLPSFPALQTDKLDYARNFAV